MDTTYPNNRLTLLAVLAHPDDESFGMGGTLALYARRGVAVHLVCATRGEAGEVDEQLLSGKRSIAELRENELRCAAQKLGLAGVHFLGYRDSGMAGSPENQHPLSLAAAPLEEVAGRVACYIRRLRPQVILTFDPIGGYRHPDHIAVHQATVRAFEVAGDPAAYPGEDLAYRPQKLYFHTFPRRWLRLAVRLMPLFGKDPRRFGKNQDVDLLSFSDVNFPVHARIDYRPVLEQKMEASSCHASQNNFGQTSTPLRWAFRLSPTQDVFTRAYPPAGPGVREHDLFE
ncbi:MAG TPA: PIG-L family deacetylase, partial [Anaerolineales bacterium]|nr:PIG-L family deacetylase [Anaerolineales bacterium]